MEITSTWVSCAAPLLAIITLILLGRLIRRRKLHLPPGPKPWPIIGNLNLMGELPHRSLEALSKKYGSLMQVKFGSHPVVVGSSVEMARAILKTHDLSLAGRPKTASGKYTTYNYQNITWAPYGPYWRQARKLCLMELFSPKRLDQFEYIRVEENLKFLNTLFQKRGKPITVRDHFSDLSFSVISRLVLGRKYMAESEDEKDMLSLKEFKEVLDEMFLLNGVLVIGDFIPWLAFLDLQGYIKRMKAVAKKMDMFMEHALEEHHARRKGLKDYEPRDMLDILLQVADDPNLEVKLDRIGVKAFTQVCSELFSNHLVLLILLN
jgi:cytochrome P450